MQSGAIATYAVIVAQPTVIDFAIKDSAGLLPVFGPEAPYRQYGAIHIAPSVSPPI